MSKRPPVDLRALTSLTSDEATPMAEAIQRAPTNEKPISSAVSYGTKRDQNRTENLTPLNFKVPPAFSKRYRSAAFNADLKLNELLFEAFEAWEAKNRR